MPWSGQPVKGELKRLSALDWLNSDQAELPLDREAEKGVEGLKSDQGKLQSMDLTVDIEVTVTVHDQWELMNRAREVVRNSYLPRDWDECYPESPTDALWIILREAVSSAGFIEGVVDVHAVGISSREGHTAEYDERFAD